MRVRASAVAAMVGTALTIGVAVTAPTAAVSAPARMSTVAADAGVQVSADGTVFVDTLSTALFREVPVLVPGDSVSAVLWVRNGGDQAGVLRLSGADAWSTSAVFAQALQVWADPESGLSGEAIGFVAAEDCALIASGPVLQPGETVPITISIGFSPATTGRDGHDARAGLDFVAALRDVADPAGSGADCSDGTVVPGLPSDEATPARPGEIAGTGLASLMSGMLAAVAAVVGIALVASARGRRQRRRLP